MLLRNRETFVDRKLPLMCGRFALNSTPRTISLQFNLFEPPELDPQFNISPMQSIPVVMQDSKRRKTVTMRWGFTLPHIDRPIFNARKDKLTISPLWSTPFKEQRCIVPIDGFYEWPKGHQRGKYAQYITMQSGEMMGLAAIWRLEEGHPVCSICTVEANDLLADIPYDRMPAILQPKDYDQWLSSTTGTDALLSMLNTTPAEHMHMHTVGKSVNKGAEGPQCIAPHAGESQQSLFWG